MARKGEQTDDNDDRVDLGVPETETTVKIDLKEPEPDDEDEGGGDEGGAAAAPAGDRQRGEDGKFTRAEKKRQRGREGAEFKQWRTEKADYDRRFDQLRQENDRFRQQTQQEIDRLRSQSSSGGGGQPADPFAGPIGEINKQIGAELQLLQSDEKRSYDRYMELQDKRTALISQKEFARLSAEQRASQPQNQPDAYAGRRTILQAEHPWMSDPRMKDLTDKAWLIRNSLITLDGRPDTLDTDREALMTAVSRFGAQYGLQAPPAAPSPRTRQYFADPASRVGAPRGGEPDEIDIPREMANGTGLDPRSLAAAVRSAVRGR